MLTACSEARGLCGENSQKILWMQGGLNMLGSGRQSKPLSLPRGVDSSSRNPCHCHIPTPAHSRWQQEQQRLDRVEKESPQMGSGRSLLSKSGLAGRGGG